MILKLTKYVTPLIIEYGITPFCNANCVFCLNYWRDKPLKFRENWQRTKKICDEIIKADVFEVYLTGGEPTVSKLFEKTVKYLHDADITISLSTNGLNITDDKFDIITTYVDKVGISLHAINKKLDFVMNNKNSFNKVDSFISRLDSVGYSYSLNYTLFPDNIEDLDETLYYVNKNYKNISGFNINRVSMVGKSYTNSIMLSREQQLNLFSKIKSEKGKYYFAVNLADVGPYCITKIKQRPCGSGFSFTYIDPWGNNMLCIMNKKPFGNILKSNLKKLWNSEEMTVFRSLEWLPNKCKKCNQLRFCQGGCKFSQSDLKQGLPYSEDILLSKYIW